MEKRFEIYAQLAAVIILVGGCLLVLRPFMTAMLFAAVVCVSTWPMYLWLLRRLKNRQSLAALSMTLSLIIVVILPLALVAYNLADNVSAFYDAVKESIDAGPPEPPTWLTGLPLVGGPIEEYWRNIVSSQEEMLALAKRMLEPARNFLLASGMVLGQGVMEMSLAAFISFFFYRDGEALIRSIGAGMNRLAGDQAANMLAIVNGTVRGVAYGLLGTALAQGIVATIGFAIAGVPAALLLGVATFLLSLIPVGPPLVWGGATIWLFQQGETGWAIFMLLWGIFLISSVDNIIKPLLISRGSSLPFLLVMLGVMGGVLAFGFVGIFIGPTLLAVGFSLMRKLTPES
ncbi:AI-2E family transporter [Sulfurimicrobium lacus]|uniref:AI-2E family transporter n=1 Tax=Sulfurimicrobium lacus TaxID=2715678 RepID=A0A6F8VDN4_9PROT|nr:AI-2E family transporter [Sulfurimicrobium lacus]BCB26875.1 AI-2E family transporter [Sulfurimicrobium lacus]